MTSRRILLAFAGSFAVYLIPLVGPHAIWLFGEQLARELTGTAHRDTAWIAADVALGLGVQIAAGLVIAWSLGGRRARLFVLPVCVPVAFFIVEAAYLEMIPRAFLIESDSAPEVRSWPEQCVARDASLMPVRAPIVQPPDLRDRWVQRADGRQALLRVPSCDVIDPNLPRPTVQAGGRVDFLLGVVFSIPGGAAILQRLDTATSRVSWWLLSRPDATLMPIDVPDDKTSSPVGSPILSDTGDAVAWLEPIPGSGPPVLKRLRIRPVQAAGDADVIVALPDQGAAADVLLAVDTAKKQGWLWQREQLLVVGFGGEARRTLPSTSPIRPQPGTYQLAGDGWLAWDAYQEEDAYQLSWSLAGGAGRQRVTKGRGITDAAVDPSGRFIAVSATTTLSIGSAPDVVYVTRASDGREVFRHYLPRYSRSSVVFFGPRLFAYSESGVTRVLRMPDD